MSAAPIFFTIADDEGSFLVDGDAGWTALIARYVRFPEPRRKVKGWPVLEPRPPETLATVRVVLGPHILCAEDEAAVSASPVSEEPTA